ncbi:hypothetical protein QN277_000991 [Acacia crassicarpa]|uniref:DUF674 domain-containing protein n=1 Tax=Acacia crassicarpa TaxID=499986 RepID=A0AAE1TGC1_9FABA|nr:hypothetical protein QN277_000991 [Acacia crassicarpa]
MESSSSSRVSLKLLIDTNTERVLFAEASKEFIDFLFNLLRLPLGTVTMLLTKDGMVGSLGKLYGSIEKLSDDYMKNPEKDKDILLKASAPLISGYLLDVNDDQNVHTNSGTSNLYMCSRRCRNVVTYAINTRCPSCGCGMSQLAEFVGSNKNTTSVEDSSGGEGGFVKGVVTYIVMDDLEVCPMSTISAITMMSKFHVKDITSLQEKVVELGMEEGVKLLKASLQCKNVLTSVFLKNMTS